MYGVYVARNSPDRTECYDLAGGVRIASSWCGDGERA